MAIAAMEAGCKELALRLVKNVNKRFPSGTRGSRLTVGCQRGARFPQQASAPPPGGLSCGGLMTDSRSLLYVS